MQAEELAKADETAPVPMHLRNAPTKMMKDMNYGSGYLYNPAYKYVLAALFPWLIGRIIGHSDTLFTKNTYRLC